MSERTGGEAAYLAGRDEVMAPTEAEMRGLPGLEMLASTAAAEAARLRALGGVEPTGPADPWAHRSSGMKCSSCMWFVAKVGESGPTGVGRCRRHAPTMSGYPVVYPTDWCGDHKLDEGKL